ncbi:hypothetical protein H5P30_10185 [Puniceicoccus vermicola]|uniref:Uncharacterized protein n=1 Tax=Puniceicoccus vermicola TaxID=388746 RepID=A0A7X1B0B9_9BACT|nr:hypothetical protein [Puniceicoccus vermicola]
MSPSSLFVAMILSVPVISSGAIYEWDFQDPSYVPGEPVSGTGIDTGGMTLGNEAIIVDGSTTPPDIFGGDGNQSTYFHFEFTSGATPILQFNIPGYDPGSPLTKGSVSFDIQLETAGYMRGAIEVDLGTMFTAGSTGRAASLAALQFNYSNSGSSPVGQVNYFENTTSGGSISSSAYTLNSGSATNVEISWDVETGSYSVFLDDNLIITSDFTVDTVTGVNAIRFSSVNGPSDIGFFIDNIQAIPEPGAAGIFIALVGGLAVLGLRRRNRR